MLTSLDSFCCTQTSVCSIRHDFATSQVIKPKMPGPVRAFTSPSSSKWVRYSQTGEGSSRRSAMNVCIPLLQQQLEIAGQPRLYGKVFGRNTLTEDHRHGSGTPSEDYTTSNVERKFKCLAEDKSVHLPFSQRKIELPITVRSTFLMVFSPQGDKVASTHGDHKIYISQLASGKVIQTLEGHPRTPWCLAFHPSLSDVVASGCLAGEVRVWDLRSGACEVWINTNGTVITSLAFHPFDHVILVATVNELHFWDWRQSNTPFMTLSTANEKEKLRFVKFDKLGSKIITGISNLPAGLRPPSVGVTSSSGSNPFNFTPIGPRSPFGMFPIINSNISTTSPSNSSTSSSNADDISLDSLARSSLRADPQINSGASGWRMSLLGRVTQMTRQLETMERNSLRSYPNASSSTSAPSTSSVQSMSGLSSRSVTNASIDSVASINSAQVSNYSQSLMSTFRRLHSLCTRLAQLMQDQQTSGRLRDASRDVRSTEASSSLNDLLMRLQESLQSMSSAALTTAIAQEEIQQVRRRVNEILERLVNVSGYRSRLSSLRDQIYDVAERYSTGIEAPDIPGSQRWDLIHCLWLVDMSIHLTRQMQRILAADYRLTQIALSNSSSGSSPSSSSPASLLSSLSQFAASSGIDISNDSELIDSLTSSRSRPSLVLPSPVLSSPSSSSTVTSSLGSSSGSSELSAGQRFHPYFSNNSSATVGSPSLSSRLLGRPSSTVINSQSSSTSSHFGSSSASRNFSIPLLRVSEPEDLSPLDESQPNMDHVFIQDIFGRERPRSPPLPEIQQVLQSVATSAAVASVSSSPVIIPSSPLSESIILDPRRPPSILQRRTPRTHPITGLPWSSPANHLWFANNSGPNIPAGGWAAPPDMGLFAPNAGGNQTHRLQCWDFSRFEVPDLRDSEINVVVAKAKIFNDASVDVNDEGTLLASLVPIDNTLSVNLCIYSLERRTFAQCLYLWTFGTNAISVSLSPLSRYIAVGLSTPRSVYSFSYPPADESVTVGQIFQLSDQDKPCPRLEHVRNINVSRGDESFSLNSIRWLPHAGEGFIYGTNRGHLVICRPEASMRYCNNPWSSSGTSLSYNSRTSTGTQTTTSPVRPSRTLSLSSTSSLESISSRNRTNLSSMSTQTNHNSDDSS